MPRGDTFADTYRCYSLAVADRSELEGGDKILLPPSALAILTHLEVQYPMLFRITNESSNLYTHVGVMEFAAPERRCYLPNWIMTNIGAEEGSLVRVSNVSLPKANFVKFRPQTSDFIKLANPKAFLEIELKKYSCLTKNQTICVQHPTLKKNFYIDVMELRPADACSIIETDLSVDFAPPADAEQVAARSANSTSSSNGNAKSSMSGASSNSAKASPMVTSSSSSASSSAMIDDDMKGLPPSAYTSSASSSNINGGNVLGGSESVTKRNKADLFAEAAARRLSGGAPSNSPGTPNSKFSPRIQPFTGEGYRLSDGTSPNSNIGSSSSCSSSSNIGNSNGLSKSPVLSGSNLSNLGLHTGGGIVIGSANSPNGRPGSASGLNRPRTLNRFEEQRRAKAFTSEGYSLKEQK